MSIVILTETSSAIFFQATMHLERWVGGGGMGVGGGGGQ